MNTVVCFAIIHWLFSVFKKHSKENYRITRLRDSVWKEKQRLHLNIKSLIFYHYYNHFIKNTLTLKGKYQDKVFREISFWHLPFNKVIYSNPHNLKVLGMDGSVNSPGLKVGQVFFERRDNKVAQLPPAPPSVCHLTKRSWEKINKCNEVCQRTNRAKLAVQTEL